jgi:hypothetical protein
MRRIMTIFVVGLLSVAGCSSEVPSTEAPRELRLAFTINGYEIGPGADLTGADLSGLYLSNANLTYADLSNADLSGANLVNADLSGANLVNADLTGANLSYTTFEGADLTNANLTYTILLSGNLSANLTGVNLEGACTLAERNSGENQFIEGFEITPCLTRPITTPPIEDDNSEDAFDDLADDFVEDLSGISVEQACGMVRVLQPPNGNNSDKVMEFLTETAESILEQARLDVQNGTSKSKYENFGFALNGVLEFYDKYRDESHMPPSALLAESECNRFGW